MALRRPRESSRHSARIGRRMRSNDDRRIDSPFHSTVRLSDRRPRKVCATLAAFAAGASRDETPKGYVSQAPLRGTVYCTTEEMIGFTEEADSYGLIGEESRKPLHGSKFAGLGLVLVGACATGE